MTDSVNLLKMPDHRLEELGTAYRIACKLQGNDILMRGRRYVTFEQFVQDRQAAEMIRTWAVSPHASRLAGVI